MRTAVGCLAMPPLVFTTLERAPDGKTNDGYCLELHGRYSHDPRSVEQLLGAVGLRARWSMPLYALRVAYQCGA